MTQMATERRLSIPVWLAVVIVLLAVSGGGWFVHRQITGNTPSSDEVVVGQGVPYAFGAPRSRVEARPGFAARWGFGGPAEGIDRRGNSLTVRRGDAILRAYRGKNAFAVSKLEYTYSVRQAWVNPAQWDLHRLAERVVDDSSFAMRLAVSDQQKKQLRALTCDAPITDAQRQTLNTLIAEWDKAQQPAKDAAGTKLLTTLAEVGAAHLAQTKSAMLTRVQEIPRILTSQQIEQAQTPAPTPATRPAGP
jgi:hypothetical protein